MSGGTRTTEFRLAPMSAGIRGLTLLLCAFPLVFAAYGVRRPLLYFVAAFLVALYLSIYLFFRPRRFIVAPEGLRILWPFRWSLISRSDIAGARILDRARFRAEYGFGMRVGAGGFLGGFGLLVTAKDTLAMYISRTDGLVHVKCTSRRSLLLTPENPEYFASLLNGKHTPERD